MYNKFFGFKEKPFKLVPNPEYLFLSKSHEEALGHLTYAISHGDGFVEITGEVGTGKTTLCRVFLENLDESIEAAYIFNPKLDALQLLKAINDEFGIDSTPDNTKDLIDALNRFLIEKKAAGQKVLVLIDEAQNLSHEVLEQLRLLSNLETTQEKLLQIILVGQPELGDLLSSRQLRQLGQRITINFQLDPLTFQETIDYIRHRISLASHRAGPPFDRTSYRAIFDYSKGVPRMINIACDRALLNAFSRNSFKITGKIAREAIRELHHKGQKSRPAPLKSVSFLALTLTAAGLVAFFSYLYSANEPSRPAGITSPRAGISLPQVEIVRNGPAAGSADTPESGLSVEHAIPAGEEMTPSGQLPEDKAADMHIQEGANTPAELNDVQGRPPRASVDGSPGPETSDSMPEVIIADRPAVHDSDTKSSPSAAPAESTSAAESFLFFLKSLNARHSRNKAMQETLRLWNPAAGISEQVALIETDQVFFQEAAAENGLQVQPIVTDAGINLIHTLNMPAILTFYLPKHAWPKYLPVVGLDNENVYLITDDNGTFAPIDKNVVLNFWSGEAHIVWKNFSDLQGIITESSPPSSVKTLKELLHDLGYGNITVDGNFDPETKRLIKEIQSENSLNADGMVGPLTKIVLYNENSGFTKPGLQHTVTANTEHTE